MVQRKKVRIFSNEYSVSHVPKSDKYGAHWTWKKNPYESECYIEVDIEDFNLEMRISTGFRRMFVEEGVLYIKDADLIKQWGLQEIDQYILNVEELKDLVFNGTIDQLEEFLKYAPQSMLDNIEIICTSKELPNRDKIKLIKSYTGKDLEEYYRDIEAEGKEVESTNIDESKKARKPRKKKVE